MPANGLDGVRARAEHADSVGSFAFSRSVTYCPVAAVPNVEAGGLTLLLPDGLPQEGDWYEFACVDGSCNVDNPIVVQSQDGTKIIGLDSVTFTNAFAWGILTFQGGSENAAPSWMLYSDEVTQQGGEAIVPILTGTVTLTPTQALAKTIVLTGSLTGAVTVVFPPNVAQRWIIDATAVTLNTHAITADANSQAWGTTIGVSDLYEVIYGGVGRLYGVALTP